MADPAETPLLAEVRALVAAAAGCGVDEVRPEGLLVGYGIDSVRAVELLDDASERFGVALDETDLRRFRTVGDVARCIAARRAPAGTS
ncbi:MAG: acyl carrier protein [Deltaproteobacteria bacterium]|nr:acyl carrier protein [Deltaproteobacteria bacterium]